MLPPSTSLWDGVDGGAATCGRDWDQRDMVRPVDGDLSGSAACDIGAIEYQVTIFWDGFEAGDWSQWSVVVGGTW